VAVAGLCCPAALAQTKDRPDALPPPSIVPTGPDNTATSTALSLSVGSADVSPLLPPAAEAPKHLPGPYFEHDPLLDPSQLPPPGWFADLTASYLAPHAELHVNVFPAVVNPAADNSGRGSTSGTVVVPGIGPELFVPKAAHLALSLSPRFQFGYRLPSGYGEFSLAYRFMESTGTDTLQGPPDGLSVLRSRLDVNDAEFFYSSSELSLWTWFDMRWMVGLRFANFYYDSRQSTPLALAAVGTGITDRNFTNRYYGFGPQAGFELACDLYHREVTLVCRFKFADLLGRIGQTFAANTTTFTDGQPVGAKAPYHSSQSVPIINVQVGPLWRPRPWLDVFAGYEYEHWWSIFRQSNITNSGMFYDQGIALRASFHY
jgi:hypothetical protein